MAAADNGVPSEEGKDTQARTVTKKEMVDEIAEQLNLKRVDVKDTIQAFLDSIVETLERGDRLEFRDFGVFEVKVRAARRAQNPKTLEPVIVPEKRTVKFKPGRKMRELDDKPTSSIEPKPNAPKPASP